LHRKSSRKLGRQTSRHEHGSALDSLVWGVLVAQAVWVGLAALAVLAALAGLAKGFPRTTSHFYQRCMHQDKFLLTYILASCCSAHNCSSRRMRNRTLDP
jgi:hypothetical protein